MSKYQYIWKKVLTKRGLRYILIKIKINGGK